MQKISNINYTLLMELVSEIGCKIAMGGAETYRVEESVNRILAAYGVESRVYSVPNSLIITIIVVYLSSCSPHQHFASNLGA